MPRRLLLVHAHPDDETINDGATMAYYAAAGVAVTLVTCTRGERGEVIPPETAHLQGDGPALGAHREGELAAAMAALGVHDHRFLGAPSARFVDSGMAYAPDGTVVPDPATPEGAFATTDLEVTAGHLADVLRDVRPQVVITYEPGGGYGHPDHVRAHDVTMRAVALARGAGDAQGASARREDGGAHARWDVPKVYEVVVPRSVAAAGLAAIGDDPTRPAPSMVVDDVLATSVVDGSAHLAAKAAALRAHATQVVVAPDETWYALSNHVRWPLTGVEYYRLVTGTPAPPYDAAGRETDLFSGINPSPAQT